jgi:hypothetical protein
VTVLTVLIAGRRSSTWLMLLVGVLAAATLQSHPTALFALAGLAAWLLSLREPRRWLRDPLLYAALAGFLLGYAPMIAANARLDSPMLAQAQARVYAVGLVTGPAEYLLRIGYTLRAFGNIVGGAHTAPGTLPQIALGGSGLALLGVSMVRLWRSPARCIVWLLAAAVLLQPLIVKGREFRYFHAAMPLAYVGVGWIAVEAARYLQGRRSWFDTALPCARITPNPWVRWLAAWSVVGTVAVALVAPLVTLPLFYREAMATKASNVAYFSLLDSIESRRACGDRLFVASEIPTTIGPTSGPAYFPLLAADYVLTMHQCPHTWDVPDRLIGHFSDEQPEGGLLVSEQDAALLSRQLDLDPITVVSTHLFSWDATMVLARARLRE